MRAPGFWSNADSRLSRALEPLGSIYGAITARRLAQAQPFRSPVPVICVGNVTAGGSGKTPVVQALVKHAIQRGIVVHCLSRGYGGRLTGPVRVDPAVHSPADVGDEPLLLAQAAPTWVARNRAAGAKAAIDAGAQLLVLDDGLQNPALAYDLSLLVIDGGFGFGNGRLIPAGPLRETLAAATARVGAAILIGDDATGCAGQLPQGLPVLRAHIKTKANDLAGRKVIGFAGLGRTEKFRATLIYTGASVAGWFPFPDHHMFSAADLHTLETAAREEQAMLVTSEKDYVRLPEDFRAKVTPLAIELVADDSHAWDGLIDRVIK